MQKWASYDSAYHAGQGSELRWGELPALSHAQEELIKESLTVESNIAADVCFRVQAHTLARCRGHLD